MIVENILESKKAAMKAGRKMESTLLGTLIGELSRNKLKDFSDELVIKAIKKMIETGSEDEIEILEKFLPSILSEDELEVIIKEIISTNSYSGMKDMGKVMKHLTENYLGRYDGKIASDLVKSHI